LTDNRVERRLAAILAADVAGYSRLMGADEEGVLARLKAARKSLVEPTVAAHRGRIVKTTGDGILVEFASAVDAARCAIEVQRGLAEQNAAVPEIRRLLYRIGIHVGDIIVDDNDIFGDGVNIAARLEGIAEPGGVCISDDAQRQIRGKVDTGFEDMGPQNLKNIAEPMRAWRLRMNTSGSPAAPIERPVGTTQGLALPDKPSIAVLPFQNMSGDPEQEYFADGMVEEIITALSRNKQLFVIARNSSFTFKGKAVDIKQVARDLGVRYVLEGSVRKSGNRIRIAGQLIDAASGAHLWADKYDGALEDMFDLQDQVASSVVGAINPTVMGAEIERAKRKLPNGLDAYDYFLRGQSAHWKITRKDIYQAIELYERSIALDSQFAPAFASLAAALNMRRASGWSSDATADAEASVANARRALDLGTQDASVLGRIALSLMFSGNEVELADGLLEEAIRLDPNEASAWVWGGYAKLYLSNYEAAIDYFQRALRQSPLDPRIFYAYSGLAYAYFFIGNYVDGIKRAAASLRHHPKHLPALRVAMACNALCGNLEVAQGLWRQVVLLSPSDRVSETRQRGPWKGDELAKLEHAYRLAGMPE
jgi:adenylate cyclase